MKAGTEGKLKFKQLQRKLKLALWEARGLLDTLWYFTAQNCPAGDIGRFSDEEIAIGIDWKGDAEKLINALTETRWIDRNDSCRLSIHDWPEHCEESVHKHLARRGLYFADGSVPNLRRLEKEERAKAEKAYAERTPNARHTPGVSPSHTLPNHTLPNPTPAAGSRSPPDVRTGGVHLPKEFDTPEVARALDDWATHFREVRPGESFTSNMRQKCLETAFGHKWTAEQLVKNINASIGHGWKTIRNVDESPGSKTQPTASAIPYAN